MGKHLEDDDAKTCAEFWEFLVEDGFVSSSMEGFKQPKITQFLRERAEHREANFGKQ